MYAEKTDYDDIEMSSRLRNVLRRNGFESLEELREYPKEHFIKFRNMGQATLQELYQICEEQGIKLRSVEDLNDKEHGVRFDDFLCRKSIRYNQTRKINHRLFYGCRYWYCCILFIFSRFNSTNSSNHCWTCNDRNWLV